MKYYQEFNNIMQKQKEIALATSINNIPNVRIVNFYYNPEREGVLFFSTFKHSSKVKEFKENSKISFTTIPHGSSEHVKVQAGTIIKSKLSIFDLKDEFIKKVPRFAQTLEMVGENLDLFEVHFDKAFIALNFRESGEVEFNKAIWSL